MGNVSPTRSVNRVSKKADVDTRELKQRKVLPGQGSDIGTGHSVFKIAGRSYTGRGGKMRSRTLRQNRHGVKPLMGCRGEGLPQKVPIPLAK